MTSTLPKDLRIFFTYLCTAMKFTPNVLPAFLKDMPFIMTAWAAACIAAAITIKYSHWPV